MPPKKINAKYIPKSLSESDKKKQITSIKNKTDRPKVKYESKRSSWVIKFENKYKTKISDTNFISKNIISKAGIDKIMSKGRGAYYSSGSRPNQTAQSWALARLASVILNGNARKVDKKIWDKYKK
tara:strand:- start:97 stop:474 length:378 start_codon:yes stop_codon:yes gene_type:complete